LVFPHHPRPWCCCCFGGTPHATADLGCCCRCQAFTNIAKILETLDTDTVVKVLTYHVSPKVYTVKFANTANVPTLLGQKLALRRPK
jgi:hypothetical protein